MASGLELMDDVRAELRLSRESRDRMVADFRQLAQEMQTRFDRTAHRLERHLAANTDALQALRGDNADILHALNAQSRGIFDLLRRSPPAAGGTDAAT
jgi:ABC-type transporter Mla subunit MlaD